MGEDENPDVVYSISLYSSGFLGIVGSKTKWHLYGHLFRSRNHVNSIASELLRYRSVFDDFCAV